MVRPIEEAFSRHAKHAQQFMHNRWPIAKEIKIVQKNVKKRRETSQPDRQTDRQREREREKRWNLIQRMNEGRCVYQMVAAALQTGQFIFTKFITHPRYKKNSKCRIQMKKKIIKRISEIAWFFDVPHSSRFLLNSSSNNNKEANSLCLRKKQRRQQPDYLSELQHITFEIKP